MAEKMTISVVIPVFNEEKIIENTVQSVDSYLKANYQDYEIIIADDGSKDKTCEIVRKLGLDNDHVFVLPGEHRGKGYVIKKGVMASRFEFIYLCDADLSTPIDALGILQEKLREGYDIVIASREGDTARRIKEPLYRHLMGRSFNLLVQSLIIKGIKDTQCGFKLFKSDVAQKLFTKQLLYSEESKILDVPAVTAYDVEILFLASKFGFKVAEVPVEWEYRENTRVNVIRDSWRNFQDVLKVRWHDLRGRYGSLPERK